MFRYRDVFLTGVLTASLSGCSPLNALYAEIRSLGFLEYKTPIAHAGTGTLVGGKRADDLFLVADPTTCFPSDSGLRRTSDTDLPSHHYEVDFSGSARADVFEFLGTGNGHVKAGAEFKHVDSIHLEMSDVRVEFMDSVELTRFYRDGIDDLCVEWLNHAAFVIEALYVGEMTFEMTSKDGGKIDFEATIPSAYLDIAADVEWEIRDRVQLVIKSPKYVGYKLGRLTVSDNGMSLFRANSLSYGKYQWKEISQFSPDLSRASEHSESVAASPRISARSLPVRALPQPELTQQEMIEDELLPEGYEPPWDE